MRSFFFICILSGFPILGVLDSFEELNHPLIHAGGMGILGWLLYYHISSHHKTVDSMAGTLAAEIKGLREDMREDNLETRRVLTMALKIDNKQIGS